MGVGVSTGGESSIPLCAFGSRVTDPAIGASVCRELADGGPFNTTSTPPPSPSPPPLQVDATVRVVHLKRAADLRHRRHGYK